MPTSTPGAAGRAGSGSLGGCFPGPAPTVTSAGDWRPTPHARGSASPSVEGTLPPHTTRASCSPSGHGRPLSLSAAKAPARERTSGAQTGLPCVGPATTGSRVPGRSLCSPSPGGPQAPLLARHEKHRETGGPGNSLQAKKQGITQSHFLLKLCYLPPPPF